MRDAQSFSFFLWTNVHAIFHNQAVDDNLSEQKGHVARIDWSYDIRQSYALLRESQQKNKLCNLMNS